MAIKLLVAASIIFLLIMLVVSSIAFVASRSGVQINPIENILKHIVDGNSNLRVLLCMLSVAVLGYIYKSKHKYSNEIVAKWKEGSAGLEVEYTVKPSCEASGEVRRILGICFRILMVAMGMTGMFVSYRYGLPLILSIGILLFFIGVWYVGERLVMVTFNKQGLILLRDSEGTYLIHNEAHTYRLADVEKVTLLTSKTFRNTYKQYRNCTARLITKTVLKDIRLGYYKVDDLTALFDKANIEVNIKRRAER